MQSFRLLPQLVIATALLGSSPPFILSAQQGAAAPSDAVTPTFKTTVRRVILDVVVTDSSGKPVNGLTRQDFSVTEDGKTQQVLSFEPYGFGQGMDYLPPKLPVEQTNTFLNLPATPETGPLYILLYDLVNMDNLDQMGTLGDFKDQMFGRQELIKFVQDKPEGTRFAVFIRSDGLHLIQGFTSDKAQILSAINPHGSKPHVPQAFLMGANFGKNDVCSTVGALNFIANYLDGLQGRKNLIWLSGGFPLSLFASDDDGQSPCNETVKATLDLLARDQIALYPVDVRGAVIENAHMPPGLGGGGSSATLPAGAGTGPSSAPPNSYSLLSNSYMVMEEIAKATGGRAFYGTNDVKAALTEATETGAHYYTLTYSPTNRNYNGKVRTIGVKLTNKGYKLDYRRAYYGSEADSPLVATGKGAPPTSAGNTLRRGGDTLDVNMQHGAPIAHQLVFGAHLSAVGVPSKGTPEQMAELAVQPAFFKLARKNAPLKLPDPISLQRMLIHYTVFGRQLQTQGNAAPTSLEVAAAAYDSDGKMLNSVVSNATPMAGNATSDQLQPKAYRIQQEIYVPLNATTIRLAVRDANTDRIGAMEIKLPLVPENESAAAPDVRKQAAPQKAN